jgi:hypothetical protein
MVFRGAGGFAAVEPASEIVGVPGNGRLVLKLVDDGQDVVERSDGVEGWSVVGSECSPGGDECEGVVDRVEGDTAVIELSRESAIRLSELPAGSRCLAVEVEDTLDIDLAPAS